MSWLEKERVASKIPLPKGLSEVDRLVAVVDEELPLNRELKAHFPLTYSRNCLTFKKGEKKGKAHRVGVLFSGGPAPGGHNVVAGLFDALKKLNKDSILIGLLGGPSGLIEGRAVDLDEVAIAPFRNLGGFDLLGTGRTKIETEEQFEKSTRVVERLNLDGLVIIGGDDSNTNAAYLAEEFSKRGVDCTVIGVPKTIDGDLKNRFIEVSFGFDTATKLYSDLIGNVCRDVLSGKKQFAFIRLMGRSASHITLECALATKPNLALISEAALHDGLSLQRIVEQLTHLVIERHKKGKNYGVVLIPEGLIEFIKGFKELIGELNNLIARGEEVSALTGPSKELFSFLPGEFQRQLLADRDPHGNVQVSKIEMERLLIMLVQEELKKENIPFSPQPFFFGYEGRSEIPTLFDANYCYALGFVAALGVDEKAHGSMATIYGLDRPLDEWQGRLIPICSMFGYEMRKGKKRAVIQKALVDLNGPLYKGLLRDQRECMMEDRYQFVGPIQYFGPKQVSEIPPLLVYRNE